MGGQPAVRRTPLRHGFGAAGLARLGRGLGALTLAAAFAGCVSTPGPALSYKIKRGVPYAEGLSADLYLPDGPGPFPGVLVIHGGGWYKGKRKDMGYVAGRLARRGYAAVSISYRFAPEHLFPAQIHDCKRAVRWMRAKAAELRIDPARIGAFGYSAGGHLAALLGTTGPEDGLDGEGQGDARVQAVVAGGAPTDLRKWPEGKMTMRLFGGPMSEKAEDFRRASPIVHASAGDAPTFFYHGAKDTLVPPEHAGEMEAALKAAGVPTETFLVPGMGHVRVFLFGRAAVEKAIDFLDRTLKG